MRNFKPLGRLAKDIDKLGMQAVDKTAIQCAFICRAHRSDTVQDPVLERSGKPTALHWLRRLKPQAIAAKLEHYT